MKTFDHIVVGSGSSGAALAGRLADAGRRVLVLEAGGPARSMLFRIPAAFMKLWFDPRYTWPYKSEPEPELNHRPMPIPRGRVVGGSSAINGMICNRGAPQDYDRWATMGLAGWSFRDVLPYFKRLESNWRGAGTWHGADGPVSVSRYPNPSPHSPLVLEAAHAMGFRSTDDFSGAQPEGVGLPDMNVRRGRRVSSADAYLHGQPTLALTTGAQVLRILVENGRAVGVHYAQAGEQFTARASGDVILCAGVINTPHILLLSGLGPAEELRRHAIEVIADLPGVGRDLEDQPGARFAIAAREPISLTRELRADRFAAAAVQWFSSGRGLLAAPPLMGFFIVRTQPGLDSPDMRMIVSGPMDSRVWFPGWKTPTGPGLNVGFSLCYPKSRGSLTLASADPLAPPRIRYGVFSDPQDLLEMRRGFKLMRDLVRQPSLAAVSGAFVQPSEEPRTDAQIDAYLRSATMTTFHPVGSCRMGSTGDFPVDAELRVRGVDGLRVADTSMFPTQIGGNPNLPAIMIAEKAADLVLGRVALPPAPDIPRMSHD